MSGKIHEARCSGGNKRIDVNGNTLRQKKREGYFNNMRQVREATKKHGSFCTDYTGGLHITAWWHIGPMMPWWDNEVNA